MKIYVNSAGFSQEYDYKWCCLDDNGQQQEVVLERYLKDLVISNYICSLSNVNNNTIVSINNLVSKKRKDFYNRSIRNSVIFECDRANREDKEFLKYLFINIIVDINKFNKRLDWAVKSNDDSKGIFGFVVDYPYIRDNFIEKVTRDRKSTEKLNNDKIEIMQDTEDNRQEMADILRNNCITDILGTVAIIGKDISESKIKNETSSRLILINTVDYDEWHVYEDDKRTNKKKLNLYVISLILIVSIIVVISMIR